MKQTHTIKGTIVNNFIVFPQHYKFQLKKRESSFSYYFADFIFIYLNNL